MTICRTGLQTFDSWDAAQRVINRIEKRSTRRLARHKRNHAVRKPHTAREPDRCSVCGKWHIREGD